MNDTNHFTALNLERSTSCNSSCGRQSRPSHGGNRFFSNEVARGQESDCRFFPCFRNDGQLCPALLNVKDGISVVPLREQVTLRFELNDLPMATSICQIGDWVERDFSG